jgi:hypothetical protein
VSIFLLLFRPLDWLTGTGEEMEVLYMEYCDVCQSAGSVNKYGFCEICGTGHHDEASVRVLTLAKAVERAELDELRTTETISATG